MHIVSETILTLSFENQAYQISSVELRALEHAEVGCRNDAQYTCTGWPKKVSHYQMIKNRIKSIKSHESLSMRLDLFVILKYE